MVLKILETHHLLKCYDCHNRKWCGLKKKQTNVQKCCHCGLMFCPDCRPMKTVDISPSVLETILAKQEKREPYTCHAVMRLAFVCSKCMKGKSDAYIQQLYLLGHQNS